jgi:hypothetical protein
MGRAIRALGRYEAGQRLKVFVSYAHRDERLREEVEKHLSALRRSRIIATWCDHRITPGTELDQEIVDSLITSDLVLLLVSPDFMNSDYCYLREMNCALRRHRAGQARVIPIILRPVDWNKTPIGKLLALPRDGKPVTSWSKRDEALLDVAKGVRRAIEEMQVGGSSRFPARKKSAIRSVRTPGKA